MDKLDINNLTGSDIVILGVTISAESSYTVPDGDIVSFAKDAMLNVQVLQGNMDITVYGFELASETAMWLKLVAQGLIVYT